MRYALLSVSMSDWLGFYEDFEAFRDLNPNPPYLTSTLPERVQRSDGLLLIVDWREKRVLASKIMPMPQGVLVEESRLLVTLRGTHEIAVLEGNEVRAVSHPWLANLHTLDSGPAGRYLVTSSATDTIAEIGLDGDLGWRWAGWENGYGTLKGGGRYEFDEGRDHRLWTCIAADHAVHVNSAIYMDAETVLATFFHHGILGRISMASGEVEVVIDGMSHPHAVRRRPGGYVVSDSKHYRVLLLDESLVCESVLEAGFKWVQDAVVVGERVFVLSNLDKAASTLEETNRVVEVDIETGEVVDEMDFGRDMYLYALEPLTEAQAALWVGAWTREGSVDV